MLNVSLLENPRSSIKEIDSGIYALSKTSFADYLIQIEILLTYTKN